MIKKNLLVTYFVQIYSAAINIILMPVYVNMLGVEQFGLIGFFMLLQNIILLLDAGISGTLTRQTATSKNSMKAYRHFLKQFRIIVLIFFLISIAIFLFGYFANSYIVTEWLKSNLEKNILQVSILSMFAILAIRYMNTPFRSGLIGLEKHILIGRLNFIFISMKLPGGLLVLHLFDNSIIFYFIYQLVVALLELIATSIMFVIYSKLILSDTLKESNSSEFNMTLKSLLIFSGQLSLLSITWIIVSQVDKFVLSSILELKEYAHYTLAVAISGVILMFSAPLSQVLMSRLSILYSEKSMNKYVKLYFKAFGFLSVIMIFLGLFIFMFSKSIIYMWSGDFAIANSSYYYAKWLALGNTISILMTLIFLLQYSTNQLKNHVIAYLSYSLILIPVSIYIANKFYGEGTAIFWFVHNVIFFITWGSIVHYKYIKGISRLLWLEIIIPTITISFIILYFFKVNFDYMSMSRLTIAFALITCALTNILVLSFYFFISSDRITKKSMQLLFRYKESS